MILNLIKFSKFIEKIHFKMETIETVLQLVTPNCFKRSVDLNDACLMISFWFSDSQYLKFFWKGQLYMYLVIPFGLTSAPHLFTKFLKPTLAHLGFVITFYLDDG